MKQPYKAAVAALFFFLSFSYSKGQSIGPPEIKRDYTKEPYWISMMEDTNANYFEVITAYDEFWAHRPKPRQEADVMNKFDRENPEIEEEHGFLYRIFHSREIKEEKEMEQYRFACKKFEHWKQINWPYVQPDGRILTPHERLEIWKEQRQ